MHQGNIQSVVPESVRRDMVVALTLQLVADDSAAHAELTLARCSVSEQTRRQDIVEIWIKYSQRLPDVADARRFEAQVRVEARFHLIVVLCIVAEAIDT